MLGSDFELFMKDASTGTFVPEFFLNLPDKGEKPVQLFDDAGTHVGFIHRDNVSVELCTLPAATTRAFARGVAVTLDAAQKWLDKTAPGLVLGDSTTVTLSKQMQQHPNAKELGCDIDFVADSVGRQSKARDALDAGRLADYRHAGGHVHISYNYEMFPAWIAAMVCDLFLGMPMRQNLDQMRAAWYGNASLHRETRYPDGTGGVEYRPLDSGWVHRPESREAVGRGAEIVQDVMNSKSNDLIAELIRVRSRFPEKCMLVDVPIDAALNFHGDALRIAANVSAAV